MIEMWWDGCCEPKNPGGHAAWGAVVHVDGVSVYRDGGYCGVGPKMSNNVAEYAGFIAAIKEALKYSGKIIGRGDSRLVVCQLDGKAAKKLGYSKKWKTKGGFYKPFYDQAVALLKGNENRVSLEWIPREKNDICDVLSKKVLKDMGITFRIQPEDDEPYLAERIARDDLRESRVTH
jgi:ribonuclease HI